MHPVTAKGGKVMNIDRIMATNIYKTNLTKSVDNEKKSTATVRVDASKEKTMDTITISADAANRKTIDKAVKLAKNEFNKEVPKDKIEMLKKAIAEGNYYVSSQDLADSIMGTKK